MSTTIAPISPTPESNPSLYQPNKRRHDVFAIRGSITRTSWLVLKHGEGLFVTESEDFMRWFLENNPGTTIREVTGHVPEALAETAR